MKIIPISGEIGWDVWPDQVRQALAEAGGDDVMLEISSPGGYVYDGLEIFNLIKNYQGNTTAKIVGMAASMASYIPLAADKVVAESNAIYMIHNARAYTGGDQNAHTKVAKILTGMSNLLAQEYIGKTGKDKKEIRSWMDAETYFMGAEAILEAGFIDEIVENGEKLDSAALEDLQLDAMLKVDALDKKLQAEPEKFENINKIAALLPQSGGDGRQRDTDPASSGTKTRGQKMTREEFLAFLETNPEAKAFFEEIEAKYGVDLEKLPLAELIEKCPKAKTEHEQALTDARAEVETGKLTKEQVGKIMTVVTSEAYKGRNSLVNAGTRALVGERDFGYFEDMLAMADENIEAAKSSGIQQNQPEKTSAEQVEADLLKKNKSKASAKALGEKLGTAKEEE